MANKVKIINQIKKFARENEEACDRGYGHMAQDVEILSKQRVPKKLKILLSSGRHRRVKSLHWRVEYGQEGPSKAYARFQEAGGDDKRVVRKYTTPGTGKEFLEGSGDKITEKAVEYIKSEIGKIRI